MEGACDQRSSLGLALVLVLATFLLFDSYHLNLISRESHIVTPSPSSLENVEDQFHEFHDVLNRTYDANLTELALAQPPAALTYNRSVTSEALQVNVTSTHSRGHAQKQRTRSIPAVERGLRRAREAIRKALLNQGNSSSTWSRPRQTQTSRDKEKKADDYYVPAGGIYRNAHAFYRSYREMEKHFKIFVYPEGEPPLAHDGPCKNIYTTEGRFIHEVELGSRFVTSNPEHAHVHFLPLSITMMVSFIYKPLSHDISPIQRAVRDYIDVISSKYPFWNRSMGADHFMLSCHDWGPLASMANPLLYKNSIRVLCNANTSEGFNPTKDVTLPEMNLQTGLMTGMLGGRSALRRPLLAFFAGGNHGPVRPILFKHWKEKNDDDIKVYEYLPKGISYYEFMKKTKYCLCPSGYEVASPRIVEAIYSECVPVILSEHYVLPFSDVLNWASFSVQIPLSQIPNLKTILQSIPVNKYVQMQKRVKQVQRHFAINQPPKSYDLFHMILHSIWLRRLNIQITS